MHVDSLASSVTKGILKSTVNPVEENNVATQGNGQDLKISGKRCRTMVFQRLLKWPMVHL